MQHQQLIAPPHHELLPAGQKLLSILKQKSELPSYVDSKINEELNTIAENFPTEIQASMAALFFDDGLDDNNSSQHLPPIIAPLHHELLPAGKKLLSILTHKTELPSHVDSKINEELNTIAEQFLTKIRSAVVDLLFEDDLGDDEELKHQRRQQQQTKSFSIKTIVDKDWNKFEKQYERAIRFFPNVLREMRAEYEYYPIQWMALHSGDTTIIEYVYNLQLVSLIPLVAKLAIELQYFGEETRGGFLMEYPRDHHEEEGELERYLLPMHYIVSYCRNRDRNNQLLDDCFFSVWERLRKENLFKKEDIQQLNLIDTDFVADCNEFGGAFTARNFCYLVDWDPTVLSVPVCRESGNWIPIHFCTENENRTIEGLSAVVQLGLKYYPEKFGHFFTERSQTFPLLPDDDNDDSDYEEEIEDEIVTGTPFEFACEVHGQLKVLDMVLNCVAKYCNASSSATNSTNTGSIIARISGNATTHDIESSLLLATVTDTSIHLDGLYILLRNNPVDTLLKLHQKLPPYPEQPQIGTNNEINTGITESNTNENTADDDNSKSDGYKNVTSIISSSSSSFLSSNIDNTNFLSKSLLPSASMDDATRNETNVTTNQLQQQQQQRIEPSGVGENKKRKFDAIDGSE